jgi:hypothetical protein
MILDDLMDKLIPDVVVGETNLQWWLWTESGRDEK